MSIISDEEKNKILKLSAQTLPDSPSREGYSAETIRKRLFKPTEALIDLLNEKLDLSKGADGYNFLRTEESVSFGEFKYVSINSISDHDANPVKKGDTCLSESTGVLCKVHSVDEVSVLLEGFCSSSGVKVQYNGFEEEITIS